MHENVEDLLFDRKKVNDGILQRFVAPKDGRNSVIRCVWTPHFCLYERRSNRLLINDKRYDYYERACTYEGKEYYSDSGIVAQCARRIEPLRGKMLPPRIKAIADRIAEVPW